ncbi:MAG TPA: translation initiation factor IF-3 [Candidatus Saccharimonadales bacterium]
MNEQIRAPQLRVIDEDGKQLGILSRNEALAAARERELDLVEISPDATPPVVKITDWGKYNYQKTKQQNKNKKAAKSLEMKQIRFGLKIGEHDLDIKLGKVRKFLEAGHKVKITIFYRGRELAHRDIGFKLADKVIHDIFGDTIIVDQAPQFAGRQLNFVVRHNPRVAAATAKAAPATEDKETAHAQTQDA